MCGVAVFSVSEGCGFSLLVLMAVESGVIIAVDDGVISAIMVLCG